MGTIEHRPTDRPTDLLTCCGHSIIHIESVILQKYDNRAIVLTPSNFAQRETLIEILIRGRIGTTLEPLIQGILIQNNKIIYKRNALRAGFPYSRVPYCGVRILEKTQSIIFIMCIIFIVFIPPGSIKSTTETLVSRLSVRTRKHRGVFGSASPLLFR